MKIRFLHDHQGVETNEQFYAEGEVVDLDTPFVSDLIRNGFATADIEESGGKKVKARRTADIEESGGKKVKARRTADIEESEIETTASDEGRDE